MRNTRDANFIREEGSGQILGFNLGADFCAEHECGIDNLKRILGIDSTKIGVDARSITKFDESRLYFNSTKEQATLMYSSSVSYYYKKEGTIEDNRTFLEIVRRTLGGEHNINKDGFSAAWDRDEFGIRVVGEKKVKQLKRLHEAIVNKDLIVFLGRFSNNSFENSGLCLMFRSTLPTIWVQQAKKTDLDAQKLRKDSEAIGIQKKLENAGLRFFALDPRWITNANKRKDSTKYDIMYWLNPFDQENNAYGMYTVEQLEMWIEGKGPIIENSHNYKTKGSLSGAAE